MAEAAGAHKQRVLKSAVAMCWICSTVRSAIPQVPILRGEDVNKESGPFTVRLLVKGATA